MSIVRQQSIPVEKTTSITINTTYKFTILQLQTCEWEIVSYLYALFRIISNSFSSILPFTFPSAIYRTRITELLNWIELQIGYLHSLHVTKYAHAHMNADWQCTEHFMHTEYGNFADESKNVNKCSKDKWYICHTEQHV